MGCRDLLLLTEKEEGQSEEIWEGASYPIRAMPVWKWLTEDEANRMKEFAIES